MKTNYPGIDYGNGKTNCDPKNGIRYGVIPLSALQDWAIAEFESKYYGYCPECGADLPDEYDPRGMMPECGHEFEYEDQFSDQPDEMTYDKNGLRMEIDSYGDVWIFKSSVYTYAQFCSPCAPGAGHLSNPCEDGPPVYCLPSDWFEGNIAPYTVHSVQEFEKESKS